ncbi:hypothetical protein IWQ62_002722 [Dispira parvispora]|uniref:Uncharacterized protein n=1 Tax=Dispira parvispora TaxID=1520584 RepID=A0A9W8AV52_9FUNG|nr:hypothetical protein IWQ62_002722 [Dispira parvispora]
MPTTRPQRNHTTPQRQHPSQPDTSDLSDVPTNTSDDDNEADDYNWDSNRASTSGTRPRSGNPNEDQGQDTPTRSSRRSSNQHRTPSTGTPRVKRARVTSPAPASPLAKASGTPGSVNSVQLMRVRAQTREALYNWCRLSYRVPRYYKDTAGRLVSKIFHELPPKDEYPDYYEMIKHPLSLQAVREKVDERAYHKAEYFINDMELIFNNAKEYNEPDSQVYKDAAFLQQLFQDAIKKAPPPFEETLEERISNIIGGKASPVSTPTPSRPRARVTRPSAPSTPAEAAPAKKQNVSQLPKINAEQVEELMRAIENADYDVSFRILDEVSLDPLALYPTEQEGLKFTWSFLHAAGFFGRVKILPALMEHGIPVDIKDTLYQGTPLAWAAYGTHKRIARSLVERYGADVNAENIHGQVPLDLVPDDEVEDWQWILKDRKKPTSGVSSKSGGSRASSKPAANIPPISRTQVIPVMLQIIEKIQSKTDDDGRQVAEMFLELPSATEYPEYYEVIDHPVALDTITRKVANTYQSFAEFQQDCRQMFSNAKFFNEQGSQVYEDAETLEAVFEQAKSQALKQHGLEGLAQRAGAPYTEPVQSARVGQMEYQIGDFIQYRRPKEDHLYIAFVQSLWVNDKAVPFFSGLWFYRPEQTQHSPTKTFYPNEVFCAGPTDPLALEGALGKCYVMPLKDFLVQQPQGFPPTHVFLCESRYNETNHSFQPIKNWLQALEVNTLPGTPLVPRPVPLQLSKLPSPLAAGVTPQKRALQPTGSSHTPGPSRSSARSERIRGKPRKSYVEPDEESEEEELDSASKDQNWGDGRSARSSVAGTPGAQVSQANAMMAAYGMGMRPMGMPMGMMANPAAMMGPGGMPFNSPGATQQQMMMAQFQAWQQMQYMQAFRPTGVPPWLQTMQSPMANYPMASMQQPSPMMQGMVGGNMMRPPNSGMMSNIEAQPAFSQPQALPLTNPLTAQALSPRSSISGPSSSIPSPNPAAAMSRPPPGMAVNLGRPAPSGGGSRLGETSAGSPTTSSTSNSDYLANSSVVELVASLPTQPWQARGVHYSPPPTNTSLIYRLQIATSDRRFFITLGLEDQAYSFHLHDSAPSLMIKPVTYHAYQKASTAANGPTSPPAQQSTTSSPIFFTLRQNNRLRPASMYVDGSGKFSPPAAYPLGIPASVVSNVGGVKSNGGNNGDLSSPVPDQSPRSETSSCDGQPPPAVPVQALPSTLAAATPLASPIYDVPLQSGMTAIELWVANYPPPDASNAVHTSLAKLPPASLQALEKGPQYQQSIKLFITK